MEKIKWNKELINLNIIKLYDKNPRKITKDKLHQLIKSIDKFGLAEPLVLNKDLTLCGGHGRVLALKELKIKEAECFISLRQLDEEEFKELNIRLNKNTGDFDLELLKENFDIPDLIDWGFNDKEIDFLEKYDFSDIDKTVGELISNNENDRKNGVDLKTTITCPNCQHEFIR